MSVWVAGISAAVTIGTTMYNNQQQKKAVQAQTDAANAANNTQLSMFNQQRADQAPWRNAGASSIGYLSYLMGVPGYQSGQFHDPNAAPAQHYDPSRWWADPRIYQSNGTDSTSHGGGFAFDPGAPLGAGLISGDGATSGGGWTGMDNTHIGSTSGPSTPDYQAPIAYKGPRGKPPTLTMANQSQIPTFNHPGEEGFQNLPSGSTFIGPDGVVRRKH